MTLPTHSLGNSGLHITRVGFGSWAVGGGGWSYGWGPQDDAASLATMRHALELGINWIDTAAIYGLGHSEEVVGRLLRELPAAVGPVVESHGSFIYRSFFAAPSAAFSCARAPARIPSMPSFPSWQAYS